MKIGNFKNTLHIIVFVQSRYRILTNYEIEKRLTRAHLKSKLLCILNFPSFKPLIYSNFKKKNK